MEAAEESLVELTTMGASASVAASEVIASASEGEAFAAGRAAGENAAGEDAVAKAIADGELDPDVNYSGPQKIKIADSIATKNSLIFKLNKVFKTINPKFNFDFTKSWEDQSQLVKDTINKVGENIKVANGDLEATSENLEAKAKNNPNPEERSKLSFSSKVLGGLASGLTLSVIIAAFVSTGETGCYVYSSDVSPRKLDCGDTKGLRGMCQCPNAPGTLMKSCTDAEESETCDTGWYYTYKKVTWWNALAKIVTHVIHDGEDAADAGADILKTIAKLLASLGKYWMYIVGALFILAIIISVIKSKGGKKG